MASADLRSELQCPICLEIYTDPVNLTCGHTYCGQCIHRLLDSQKSSSAYTCPECRKSYRTRPVLHKNIALCNIVKIFKSANPEQSGSEVFCSYCIYSTVPAVQACLHCEASLCSNHLRSHRRSAEHVFVEPTECSENNKCSLHNEILKYYCFLDDACVCATCCLFGEHLGHQLEVLDVAYEKKKETLGVFIGKLQSKREKIEKRIKDLEERGQKDPGSEEDTVLLPDMRGEEVLYTISNVIQLFQIIKNKVSKKISYIEELCRSNHPLSILREKVGDFYSFIDREEDEEGSGQNFYDDVGHYSKSLNPLVLVLDINTAANNILVSDDLKTMYWTTVYQNRSETEKRFHYNQILSVQIISSGEHYWEVETSESGDWRLGVAYSKLDRKVDQTYFGDNNKSWCLRKLCKNQYSVMHDNMVTTCAHMFSCNRVRIFLDYDAGQLSFYELCSPIIHLHTIMATFTKPLHAAFGIGYWLSGEHCCLKILH